jgi:hypothetical protein
MIHIPILSSKDLLARLTRLPPLTISFDDAFRALAVDVVRLQEANEAMASELKALKTELVVRR